MTRSFDSSEIHFSKTESKIEDGQEYEREIAFVITQWRPVVRAETLIRGCEVNAAMADNQHKGNK